MRSLILAALVIACPTFSSPSYAGAPPEAESAHAIHLGNQSATSTLVVYTSPTCSHCVDFERRILPELKKRYVADGTLRIELRPFVRNSVDAVIFMVLDNVSQLRKESALSAFTARFEEIKQSDQKEKILRSISSEAGIDGSAFNKAVADTALLADLKGATAEASKKFGVKGTPWFILDGRSVSYDGTVESLFKPRQKSGTSGAHR
ncbi:DsbA family protein [Ensifer sp. SL37]|uniref:DsbA family protein n=1 Tax=Ensifer sp. SL37 TaxID=2995137 RepID=UPI002275B570|nr:thioredoxin domain-containing protein [Ensifer sp. SL37]MCY1740552.1 thioredoxin domain-containing protein [Ensifer sp. SL37]